MKGEKKIEDESWAIWRNPKFERTDVSFCHFHSEKLEGTLIIFEMSVDPSEFWLKLWQLLDGFFMECHIEAICRTVSTVPVSGQQ